MWGKRVVKTGVVRLYAVERSVEGLCFDPYFRDYVAGDMRR